jgi:prepilin-type N-terminal cleavage/methylation domain-containing protein
MRIFRMKTPFSIQRTGLPAGSSPVSLRRRFRCSHGFTLIELLMVIGIIGLIMTVAIPFFNGIGQGSKLDTATTELRFALMQARQYAITRRERVYVVFPDKTWTPVDPQAPKWTNIAYRAYAICTTNAYIREWAFLPQGLYFDRNFPTAASGNNLFTQNTYLRNAPGLWSISQRCLSFRTDGSLETRNSHPEVAIGEGDWFDQATSGTFPKMRSTNTLNSIQIYGFTGMPQLNRK